MKIRILLSQFCRCVGCHTALTEKVGICALSHFALKGRGQQDGKLSVRERLQKDMSRNNNHIRPLLPLPNVRMSSLAQVNLDGLLTSEQARYAPS